MNVYKKQIFNFKPLLPTKIRVIIHNNASSSEKCSDLNQERNLHRSSTVYKPKQLYTNMWLDLHVRDNIIMLLWIMESYFSQKQWFEFKNVLKTDLFQLLSPDVNWWTGVVWITCGLLWCFYQLFGLSFWRHPFTAEHPLLRQWCNATFLQIWWRNKLIYILDDLRVSKFSFFWMNYSFNKSALYSSWFHSSSLWCLCSSR